MLEIDPSKTSPTNGTIYCVFLRSTVSRSASVATCSCIEECSTAPTKNASSTSRLE